MGKTPEAGGGESPKMTKAERSAANKAAHAAREAAKKARAAPAPLSEALAPPAVPKRPLPGSPEALAAYRAEKAEIDAKLRAHLSKGKDVTSPPEPRACPYGCPPGEKCSCSATAAADDDEDEQPRLHAAPPPPLSHGRAHPHPPAREGEVLGPDEPDGIYERPVPSDTVATARYRGFPHVVTDETDSAVTALRYAGQDDEEICLYLRISMETLYRCYRVTMDEAHARMSGVLAIKVAEQALGGNFKATQFVASKRLRGFGAPDKPFVAVRPSIEAVDIGFTTRNSMGQSADALGVRKKVGPPMPDERGVRRISMVLGVAERPLRVDAEGMVVERTDAEIADDVAQREADGR